MSKSSNFVWWAGFKKIEPAQLMAINGTQRNTQANLGSFSAYNRALSATEILQNYNATKGRYR